ncbi:MAG: type II secretion system protein F [Planctomycetota bacterium]|jgi:type II secretion system protein F
MPIYEYKAYAPGGATQAGIVDADTERDARNKLRREKLLVHKITEVRGRGSKKKKRTKGEKNTDSALTKAIDARAARQGPGAKEDEIICGVTRQLATLLGSGIPLTDSLSAIVEQAEKRNVETMFRQIREDIQTGVSLADALGRHPRWFSELYVNMVSAGQATGNLDGVLKRLADYMQMQRGLRSKVVGALTYPMMMLGIGFIVVTILMAKVVPEITAMLIDQGKALPPATKILVMVSKVFQDYWWVLFAGIAIASTVLERFYKNSDKGRLAIDKALLRIPVLGELLRKAAVGRFTRTLATLLQSGVPVIQSLDITRKVVGNRVVADATEHIKNRVIEGTDISTPLKASGAFPSVVGYMVAVGEQSGELEEMLDRIAGSFDEEIDVVTERFTALLEPIMIVFLAGIVGFIVYAIVQPILEIGRV